MDWRRRAWAFVSREARDREIAGILIGLLSPSLESAVRAVHRGHVRQQLMTVAAALAAYRADRGVYPRELAALVPAWLPELPRDLFRDAPLVYRPSASGYILYSLGANGKDDQGSSRDEGSYLGYPTEFAHGVPGGNVAVFQMLDAEEVSHPYQQVDAYDALEIPAAADDHAIRVPPVKLPLPPAFSASADND